ncbi:MAG TPA: hypothetical protein DCG49_02175 [Ruminococcus sp.]|nr:hypothetical protein [Ruminococcus sp.]
MSLLKSLLQQLFRDAAETVIFDDLKSPNAKPKKPGSAKKPSSAAKKTTSAKKPTSVKKPAVAGKKKPEGVTASSQIYTEQSIFGGSAFYAVPQQIRQMRTLSGYNNLNGTRSMESLFYQQGKFMEHFTDDYPDAVQCGRSTPMYYNMKDQELRAYFTWRTRYRQGALPAAQNAFLLLYAYECLNLIGFQDNASAAYDALGRLLNDYGTAFPSVKKSLLRWMPDFAAYYQLPYRLEDEKEAAAITILRHSSHTEQELLLALDTLSKYHIKDSKLYLAKPDEVAAMLKAVYKAVLNHYAEHKHASFSAYLLGEQKRQEHLMFEGAMFYYRSFVRDGAYRLSPLCVYHCYQNKWAKETFCSTPHADRIGAFLRTFDAILREILQFKGKLKAGELPEGDAAVIRQAILDEIAEQKKRNAPVITLDADELEAIRKAADHTADMLTLPEDAAEEIPEPDAEPDSEQDADTEAEIPDLPLSAPAMALLICLVTGESYAPLTDAGHMLSVLADEINENLYDSIGDTVIETDENGLPVLVADYLDELKGMLET